MPDVRTITAQSDDAGKTGGQLYNSQQVVAQTLITPFRLYRTVTEVDDSPVDVSTPVIVASTYMKSNPIATPVATPTIYSSVLLSVAETGKDIVLVPVWFNSEAIALAAEGGSGPVFGRLGDAITLVSGATRVSASGNFITPESTIDPGADDLVMWLITAIDTATEVKIYVRNY